VPQGYLAIGRVVGVHGLRGEVKVEPLTDFPERFEAGSLLYLGTQLEEVEVLSGRPHKGHFLVTFDDYTDRSSAEELRGLWLFVPEDAAADLDPNTYWVHDILGLSVLSEDGRTLGTVTDVLFTGANEVYVVTNTTAPVREILLPATDEVILSVDLPARRLNVRLLPGLAD
jgi:16S rRNA processing protein RimM